MAKRFTNYDAFLEPEYEEKDTMKTKKRRNPKKKHTKDNKRKGFVDNSEINWEGDE